MLDVGGAGAVVTMNESVVAGQFGQAAIIYCHETPVEWRGGQARNE